MVRGVPAEFRQVRFGLRLVTRCGNLGECWALPVGLGVFRLSEDAVAFDEAADGDAGSVVCLEF